MWDLEYLLTFIIVTQACYDIYVGSHATVIEPETWLISRTTIKLFSLNCDLFAVQQTNYRLSSLLGTIKI